MGIFIVLATYLAGVYGEISKYEKGTLGQGPTHLDRGVHPLNVRTVNEGTGGALWNTGLKPGRRGSGMNAKLLDKIRSLPPRTLDRLKNIREIFRKGSAKNGISPNFDRLLNRVERLRPGTHGVRPIHYPNQHPLLTPHIGPLQKPLKPGKRHGGLGKRLRKNKKKLQKKIRKALKKQRKNKKKALKKQIQRRKMLQSPYAQYRDD